MPGRPIATAEIRVALRRFAASVLDHGFEATPYCAATDILLARPPRVNGVPTGGELPQRRRTSSVSFADSIARVSSCKDLLTRATWHAAHVIVDLVGDGRRVGVMSSSHKAIHNLLDQVEKVARGAGFWFEASRRVVRTPTRSLSRSCRIR
jgi:hypothetical protein